MTNTPNLALHTWAPEDPVNVAEVNENFQLLDQNCITMLQALAAVTSAIGTGGHTCRIAFGSYTGNGQCGSAHPNVLRFDFTPVVMLHCTSADPNQHITSLCLRGSPYCNILGNRNNVTWGADSISWYYAESNTPIRQGNYSGYQYYYVVLGYSE